ncbi:hypothetical protein [Edaphobacter modestus]|uniref:hypothetical protein n=1 Tax=Edaphobacter modestus TaxID=388466 RepID=UPI00102CE3D4|nr:hypothetical protein [Edaphobacter modestus]
MNRTLQDRLVKELRLAGVCNTDEGNAFRPEFLQRFNERFAVRAIKPENMHRTFNVPVGRLMEVVYFGCPVAGRLDISDSPEVSVSESEMMKNPRVCCAHLS